MPDFPRMPSHEAGSTFGFGSVWRSFVELTGQTPSTPTSQGWPVANTAFFIPLLVPRKMIAYAIIMGAGATVSGNFDVGIYDRSGNRIVSSGATAKAADVEQIVNITDTEIGPGLYYMAMVADSTANYGMGNLTTTDWGKLAGILQMASAYPLPNPVTFAALASFSRIPVMLVKFRKF